MRVLHRPGGDARCLKNSDTEACSQVLDAGGLDLAIEEVFAAECAWQCEYDAAASKVLAAHWPDVPNLHDVTQVDWARVEPVDIMCGGYPCQPFSAAGQRKGTDDDRHLWPYFAEAIRRIRPRYVVLENVAGHRSMGFDSVLGDLATLGYDAQWCSIRASDVGAPHRRERLFVLATDSTRIGRGSRGAESTGFARRPDATECRPENVELLPTPSAADGAGGHLSRSGDRSTELLLPGVARAYATGDLLPTPCAARSGRNKSASLGAAVRPSLDSITDLLPTPNAADGNGGGRFNSTGHQSTLPGTVRELLPTPRRSDGDGGPNPLSRAERMDDVETRIIRCAGEWGKYAPAIHQWESVTRPAPSPTELNSKGNPRLAAAFSEWMQGWGAGWVTAVDGLSRNDQLRIIGNGVVTLQAVAALRWLLPVSEVAA